MNESGIAAERIASHFGCQSILIVYGDLDVPAGTVKLRRGQSRGSTHNGVKSILAVLPRAHRLKIGLRTESHSQSPVGELVLQPRSEEENHSLCLTKVAQRIQIWCREHS